MPGANISATIPLGSHATVFQSEILSNKACCDVEWLHTEFVYYFFWIC